MQWFEVDKQGLAKILERKGKAFVLFELVSNAWDENATEVDVTLQRIAGTRNVRLTVRDNNPTGFADLSHAYKIWAESAKKGEAGKRGRFNIGEKLVLALCESAQIASTSGTVTFDAMGRHVSRKKLAAGSEVSAVLRMTEAERLQCDRAARALLPPAGITTRYNGELLAPRPALASCEGVLATEVADGEGMLRRSQRRTTLDVHDVLDGETPTIYEMGVPVVECGLPWHVNVAQKVPLSFDRDNVPPAYLARVRALVLELMHAQLDTAHANDTWVRDAIEHHGADLSEDAVQAVVALRFGEKRVSYDPSDPEANALAVAKGYTVVHGGQMSSAEWDAVRRTGAILPAGRVTPSPKPYQADGKPLQLLADAQWTSGMHAVAALARALAQELLDAQISVQIASEVTWPFAATYGPGRLVLNLGRLGHKWFTGPIAPIMDLLIHEFGHHEELNHLSERFHQALTRLGGRAAALALERPEVFGHWAPAQRTAAREAASA